MKNSLKRIYLLLFNQFGHRKWWPGETRDEIIIGAILTQSVSWGNVNKAIENLRQNELLSLKAIYEAQLSRIAPLIKPTRFYNQKALKLKNFCDYLFSKYDGNLDSMFTQDLYILRKELLNLKGLGEETVDSILLYAGEKNIFVVDAYTQRILKRLGMKTEGWKYQTYQRFFMENLEPELDLYKDYHAQIVYLGHFLCKTRKPNCFECPIKDFCIYPSDE
jgi:endonuclease III related protein